MAHLLRYRRGQLEAGGACSHHHDVLAGQVHVVVPAGGVERRPLEVPRDIRHERTVQLPNRADDRAGADRVPRIQLDQPGRAVAIPGGRGDLGVPADVFAHAVLVHHRLEVGLQLGLAGEELTPVVTRFEAVAVEVVANVDPSAGIGVLPPGAPDPVVLLDDGVGQPRFLHTDRGEQPRHPTTDDHHGQASSRSGVGHRSRRTRIGAVEFHLLEQHPDVLVGHVLAHQPVHHRLEHLGGHRLRLGTPTVPPVADHPERERARGGLVLRRHDALHLVEEQALRAQRALQDRGVTTHVDTRQQQRRNREVLQRRGQVVVAHLIDRERHSGVGIAHGAAR